MSAALLSNLRPTVAEISIPNLLFNFRLLKKWIQAEHFFCPMVKANAYGHGDIRVAQALENEGATHLGVALIEEGLRLREAGLKLDVLIFGLLDSTTGAEALIEKNLTPVIGDFRAFEILSGTLKNKKSAPFKIHVEFNTGMNRLGFNVDQAPEVFAYLQSHPEFQLMGVCTHFFAGKTFGRSGSDADLQLAKLQKACAAFDPKVCLHALNSDAAAVAQARNTLPQIGFRPGISLYGGEPSSEIPFQSELKPVMTLKTKVAAWHRLQVGETVSYNATWKATRPSLIAVLPLGYADGYMRALSNRGFVLCRGERAPVVGTVCMDYMMVDLTEVEKNQGELAPNEPIVLWGEQASAQLRADEIAQWLQTISYEIFTRVGERVPRVYKENS